MKRGYEGITHQQRAGFSAYLQGLRERAGLSQAGLADEADSPQDEIDSRDVAYFEAHPAEPLSKRKRRGQLRAICKTLAQWLGEDERAVRAEVNRLGGGI